MDVLAIIVAAALFLAWRYSRARNRERRRIEAQRGLTARVISSTVAKV